MDVTVRVSDFPRVKYTAAAAAMTTSAAKPAASILREWLGAGAAGTAAPFASTINYLPGSDTPNLVLVPLSGTGRVVNLYSDQGPGGTVQVAADVVGYVSAG